ncbi:MAG: O-antigen ligase family protein [Bacteroidota bacterium]|nr:O-antigen ligase family protein [Bacteroidota bacterium]
MIPANFLIAKHISISSITIATVIPALIIANCIKNEYDLKNFKKLFILILSILPISYLLGCIINFETPEDIEYCVKSRTIIIAYSSIFFLLPFQKSWLYNSIMGIYILVAFSLSIWTLYNFSIHFENLTSVLLSTPTWDILIIMFEQSIPLNIYHHFFSFFMFTGFLFNIYMCIYLKFIKSNNLSRLGLFCLAIWFFLFAHFLASRTGLMFIYLTLVYIGIDLIVKRIIKLQIVIISVVLICGFIAVMFRISPVLRLKYDNLTSNFYTIDNANLSELDNSRIESIKLGLKIISDNPWKGISPTKADSVFKIYYKKYYPNNPENWLKPHNQFIDFGAQYGLVSLFMFILALVLPFIILFKQLNIVSKLFYLSFLIYCLYDVPFTSKEFYYFFSFWTPFLFHYSLAQRKEFEKLKS